MNSFCIDILARTDTLEGHIICNDELNPLWCTFYNFAVCLLQIKNTSISSPLRMKQNCRSSMCQVLKSKHGKRYRYNIPLTTSGISFISVLILYRFHANIVTMVVMYTYSGYVTASIQRNNVLLGFCSII